MSLLILFVEKCLVGKVEKGSVWVVEGWRGREYAVYILDRFFSDDFSHAKK